MAFFFVAVAAGNVHFGESLGGGAQPKAVPPLTFLVVLDCFWNRNNEHFNFSKAN